MSKYLAFLVVAVCGAAGMYLLKSGIARHVQSSVELPEFIGQLGALALEPLVIGAIFLYGLAMVAVVFIIARYDVSYGFPIAIGINVLMTTLMAAAFLGEAMTAMRMGGIALVILGVFLIHSSH